MQMKHVEFAYLTNLCIKEEEKQAVTALGMFACCIYRLPHLFFCVDLALNTVNNIVCFAHAFPSC